jgi:dinuclear metal center YbgI/SA1388 family protein
MIKRDEIITIVTDIIGKELLEKALTKDEVANGVQFLGTENVEKIAFGVTLTKEFLEKAVKWGAQMCIFHHGFDPRTYKSLYPKFAQERLQLIFKHNLSILGYHYALDAHPVIGNNAQIILGLGAKIVDTLYEEWGFVGQFPQAMQIAVLEKKMSTLVNKPIVVFRSGQKEIKRIGVVSGAGKPNAEHIREMEEKKVDLFISGETSEGKPEMMEESGIAYFVCGHYATETFGVKALCEELKNKFKNNVEYKFIKTGSRI